MADREAGGTGAAGGMRRSVVSGIKWSSLSQFGRQAIQFATTMVLARLLQPSDFGLVGMATVVTGFVGIFKDLGTSAAVIQKKELSQELLSTIFWLNAVFGAAAGAAVFFTSPMAAQYYRDPRLVPLLQALSATFAVSGVTILQQSMLARDLEFDAIAKIELASSFAGAVVGIAAALRGQGAWSLVYQTLAMTVVATALLWRRSGWRPSLCFEVREIKSIGSFSMNLTGYSILNYFSRNVDYLLIGRYLGASELGYYTLAYRLMLYPLQSVSSVVSRVMFPVYSRMQDDLESFRRAYLDIIGMIAMVTFPMMAGLWIVAEPFIVAFYGEKWRPVVLLLLILAPAGLLQSIVTTVGTIYQARGRTDWMFRIGIVTSLVAVAAIVTGLQWGVVGVASCYAAATALLVVPNLYFPFRLIGLPFGEALRRLYPVLACSLGMLAFLFMLKGALPLSFGDGAVLTTLLPAGALSYGGLLLLLKRGNLLQLPKLR